MSKRATGGIAPQSRFLGTIGCLVLWVLLATGGRAQGASAEEPLWLVNLNAAGQEELERLPGIGPARAKAIIQYRARRPFRSAEEVIRVKGIGPKLWKQIRPHVVVPPVRSQGGPSAPSGARVTGSDSPRGGAGGSDRKR